MINPDFRYTPEPGCTPFRIILHRRNPRPAAFFQSAPLQMTGTKSATARQTANAKRTFTSLADDGAGPFSMIGLDRALGRAPLQFDSIQWQNSILTGLPHGRARTPM
jgi:hypothetical protein